MKSNEKETIDVWEALIGKESKVKLDNKMLHNAIKQGNFELYTKHAKTKLNFLGIPRGKRGEVWQLLAEEFCSKVAPIDTTKCPNYHVPYENLLKQLTSHQHAILIDLGT